MPIRLVASSFGIASQCDFASSTPPLALLTLQLHSNSSPNQECTLIYQTGIIDNSPEEHTDTHDKLSVPKPSSWSSLQASQSRDPKMQSSRGESILQGSGTGLRGGLTRMVNFPCLRGLRAIGVLTVCGTADNVVETI